MADDDQYQEPPTAVLTGEIVLDDTRAQRHTYTTRVDEDVVEAVIHDRLILGHTLRYCHEKHGISIETVRNWCNESKAKTGKQLKDVAAVRARLFQRLDGMVVEAQKILRGPDTPAKVKLDSIGHIRDLTRVQATLAGANMPTNIDLSITQETEQDRELRDMINSAKAKAAREEAEIIAAASADPDL